MGCIAFVGVGAPAAWESDIVRGGSVVLFSRQYPAITDMIGLYCRVGGTCERLTFVFSLYLLFKGLGPPSLDAAFVLIKLVSGIAASGWLVRMRLLMTPLRTSGPL